MSAHASSIDLQHDFDPTEDVDEDTVMGPNTALELPLEIRNVAVVDDAGSEQFECVMTADFIVAMYKSGLLTLDKNIRPAHANPRLTGKTKTKVNKWTAELLENGAIIGNISIRLDPTDSEFEFWTDEETGQDCLTVYAGHFDSAVDSLSRIKAIIAAAENPLRSFNLGTRFQVRIWVLDDAMAKKVATIYNTRGDKVNDSTAKFAYSETKEQEIARKLVNGSPHLGQANVEVLSNSVSASSSKLCAYNTIAKALELSWKGGPVSDADVAAQSSWLIHAWDALVAARPEYGIVSTPKRQEYRRTLISGAAVVIYGLIGAMSRMYTEHIDPAQAFATLADRDSAGGDLLALDNEAWVNGGVVAPTSEGSLSPRNSFQARRAATRILAEAMGLDEED